MVLYSVKRMVFEYDARVESSGQVAKLIGHGHLRKINVMQYYLFAQVL